MENSELHAVIKYLGRNSLSPKAMHEYMVEVLGDDAVSYQVVKNWSREFRCGSATYKH